MRHLSIEKKPQDDRCDRRAEIEARVDEAEHFSRSARWRRPTRQHVARWHREAGRKSCSCEGGRKPKIRKRDTANREQERCSAREPERYDPLVGARAIRGESAG